MERRYRLNLRWFLNRRMLTYATLILFCLATWGMTFVLPSGFIPNEDQGMIYVNVDAPPGATLERSERCLEQGASGFVAVGRGGDDLYLGRL